MGQKYLKAQRTRDLEKQNRRCSNTHPNFVFIRCEFAIDEWHDQHIGRNGLFVWKNETRKQERRYVTV